MPKFGAHEGSLDPEYHIHIIVPWADDICQTLSLPCCCKTTRTVGPSIQFHFLARSQLTTLSLQCLLIRSLSTNFWKFHFRICQRCCHIDIGSGGTRPVAVLRREEDYHPCYDPSWSLTDSRKMRGIPELLEIWSTKCDGCIGRVQWWISSNEMQCRGDGIASVVVVKTGSISSRAKLC